MRIALFQLTSQLDPLPNMEKIRKAAQEVKKEGALALFLPECFYSLSDGRKATPYLVQEGNTAFENIRQIAQEHGLYLLGGSVAYALTEGKVVNRALNFDPNGNLLSFYDKINLFSCDFVREGKRKVIDEGDIYTPGNLPLLASAGPLKIGYGICFDLRYPQHSCNLTLQGANLLTYASAFTIPTGKAHWHVLVRARAIENQCFVVAAAQWGRHNDLIQTFGHSLVVDPWGNILCDLENGEKWKVVDLDLSLVDEIRRQVKVF